MRLARQRAVVVIVAAVLVIAGVAYAVGRTFPSSPADAAASATTTATAPVATVEATPAVVPTTTAEATTVAPPAPATKPAKKPAKKPPATPAVDPGTTDIASLKPLSPAPGVKTIVVDKSAQQVTLYKADGTPVDTFRCASGKIYPRLGTYKVYGHRQQSYSMYDDTTFFYFTMFVKSDKGNNIGFHSIPQEPNGTLVGGLGKPVSHGCVRLDKAKAKFLYSWAKTGTKVIVKR